MTYEYPSCYKANGDPFPLCAGNNSSACDKCALYEGAEEDDGR